MRVVYFLYFCDCVCTFLASKKWVYSWLYFLHKKVVLVCFKGRSLNKVRPCLAKRNEGGGGGSFSIPSSEIERRGENGPRVTHPSSLSLADILRPMQQQQGEEGIRQTRNKILNDPSPPLLRAAPGDMLEGCKSRGLRSLPPFQF